MYVGSRMKPSRNFNQMLKEIGYSTKAIEQVWKWYDCSEKKGAANY